jgi:acetyltransferase-like isoleucine patch superfamily enzyme
MKSGEYGKFKEYFMKFIENKPNRFHPLVFINGESKIGKNVSIGFFSEVNAKGSSIEIGDNCDIASFVSINVADSHKRCIGMSKEIERDPITIENNVFIGSHCFIGRGTKIGHHSVIGAGVFLIKQEIPPFSLVTGNPLTIKKGYYKDKIEE